MIEWDEYVSNLLLKPDDIDGITVSFDAGKTMIQIPPIVKVSILILDKMLKNQGYKQIMIFPERQETALVFALARVIHIICIGEIEKEYDPASFNLGEKLKIGNAVVEYLGIEESDGQKYLLLRMSDLDKLRTPISTLPILQKTDTKRPLSKNKKFNAERNRLLSKWQKINTEKTYSNILYEYKTHMGSSVYYVTTVASAKEKLLSLRICNNKVSDLLLIGQVDYEGKMTNIGAGQLKGIPAVILASDLYAVNSSLEQGNPVHSIIVEIANIDEILSQLDVLDILLAKKIPIIFVTDTPNSFRLGTLADRGFNTWRWFEDNLTSELYDVAQTIADKRIGHCVRQKLHYIKVIGSEISESAKILAKYRKDVQEQSAPLMNLYERLSNISFRILRETVPLDKVEQELTLNLLKDCQKILNNERIYMSEESFIEYGLVIHNYMKVFSNEYILQKYNAMCEVLQNNKNKKIIIVIPEMTDKNRTKNYWKQWINRRMLHIDLKVCFPTEYYASANNCSDITIIVGWLKRAIMRKVIFSYNTETYLVMLYDYENRWKNHDIKRWDKVRRYSNNKEVIQRSLNDEQLAISISSYEAETLTEIEDIFDTDELEEINFVLRQNRYKQFITGDLRKSGEVVEAIPINYVGGFLAFYQKGHRLVTATKIIVDDIDKIKVVLPEELHVGDFVVVRESERDIVKDMADVLLKNSNKYNLRELASKWREVIKDDLCINTEDEFFQKMAMAGCEKETATIKNWIDDEEMIAPRAKEDLQCIADATGSEELKAIVDDVYEAAKKVREAHIQAGRILSNQLKLKIVDVLRNYGNIDAVNFWEPIEIEVKDIGMVKVLKITDIGSVVSVDTSNTNRLIEESR